MTGKNLAYIEQETGLDPWTAATSVEVKDSVPNSPIPPQEEWRLPLLCQYMYQRQEMKVLCQDTNEITQLIDSLCSS